MHGHAGHPFLIDRRHSNEGSHIHWKTLYPPNTDAMIGIIDLRMDAVKACLRVIRDLPADSLLRVHWHVPRRQRIARNNCPVFQQQRKTEIGAARELPVKAAEIARQQRHLDYAGKIPFGIAARAAQRKIRLAARDRRMEPADIERIGMLTWPSEIVLVAIKQFRRGGLARDDLR